MDEALIDLIANDGRRNAAGGIYSTCVYEFANAIEAEAIAPLLVRIAELESRIATLTDSSEMVRTWRPIETAPRDGRHILTRNVTPTYDEDSGKTETIERISVAYWLFGDWMEFPANPRFVQGQQHTHWMPLPALPKDAREAT